MITLETARLRIRDHLESDLADLHNLLSDGHVMRYLPDIRCVSLALSEQNLREALEQACGVVSPVSPFTHRPFMRCGDDKMQTSG